MSKIKMMKHIDPSKESFELALLEGYRFVMTFEGFDHVVVFNDHDLCEEIINKYNYSNYDPLDHRYTVQPIVIEELEQFGFFSNKSEEEKFKVLSVEAKVLVDSVVDFEDESWKEFVHPVYPEESKQLIRYAVFKTMGITITEKVSEKEFYYWLIYVENCTDFKDYNDFINTWSKLQKIFAETMGKLLLSL